MLLSTDAVTVTERVEQNNIFQTRGYADAGPWFEMMAHMYILKI